MKSHILTALVTSLAVYFITFIAPDFAAIREIKKWESPDGKYALAVILRTSYIDLFSLRSKFMLVAGHKGAVPSYGHPKNYSFPNGYPDFEDHIHKCTVEWSLKGLTFKEPTEHILFIPKQHYEKGR